MGNLNYQACISKVSTLEMLSGLLILPEQAAVVPNPSSACMREKEHATVKVIPAEDPVIEDQVSKCCWLSQMN